LYRPVLKELGIKPKQFQLIAKLLFDHKAVVSTLFKQDLSKFAEDGD